MDQRQRAYLACAGIVGIFLLVQLGALALVGPFQDAGYQAVEDPQNPANSLVYVLVILVATAVMLAVIRYGVDWLLRLLLVGSGAYIALFILRILVPPVVTVAEVNVLAVALAGLLGVVLWVYPEWYVIDAAGVLMGAGAAGLFGISFGVLPALLLLVVLAVYDAISVYGTEHMLTLASGVMDLKVPIVLVVPLSLSYSYLDADMPDPVADHDDGEGEQTAEPADTQAAADGDGVTADADGDDGVETDAAAGDADDAADTAASDGDTSAAPDGEDETFDRDALFIGLGDAVIPTVLVASAAFFAPETVPEFTLGVTAALPAWTAMVGTIAGLVVLLGMVLKGRAHAGLPLLNGGAIAGYLVGALVGGLSLVQALGIGPYV